MFQNSQTSRVLSCLRGCMTFGINNDSIIMERIVIIKYLNLMSTQQSEYNQSKLQIQNSETTIYHINKLYKILVNYHQRNFLNCFKWHVLQSLLKNMSNQSSKKMGEQKLWLYQSLFQKKNKTQQQMIELQFIDMCASKIQCAFKAYIHQKRHRMAVNKLNKFKNAARAVVEGWKVRQIFRSVKIQEYIKTIRVEKYQLNRQHKVVQQTQNKYSMRKLQYLKNSLQDQVRKFSSKFQYLYATGEWVFEPKIEKKKQLVQNTSKWAKKQPIKYQKEENIQLPVQQEIPKYNEKQQQNVPLEIPKKKRVRQMRDRNPRSKAQQKIQKQQKQVADEPINNEFTPAQFGNQITERPIKAKGVYKFEQLPNEFIDEPQPSKKTQVLVQKKSDNTQKNQESNDGELQTKKNAEREKNKQKMQTRQKYDPRKAIQAEKKRKKQQEQQQLKTASETIIEQKPISKPNVVANPHDSSKSVQKVVESKSQKILKNVEKEEISNRSTVNLGKGKSKVQAKIDCWGSRKTNKQNTVKNENNRMTYKMIHQPQQIEEKKQEIQVKQLQSKGISLLNKIKEQRLMEKERKVQKDTRQQNYIQSIQQQLKNTQNWAKNNNQEKSEPNVGEIRKLSTPLRQKMKKAEEMRQREAHKQIEELEKVYTEQYQTRFQRLLPKLHLLAAARQQQSQGPIPVILNNGNFMRQKISENLANNRFWMIGKKIENTFKQFDRTI